MRILVALLVAILLFGCAHYDSTDMRGRVYPAYVDSQFSGWYFYSYDADHTYYLETLPSEVPVHGRGCSYEVHMTCRVYYPNRNIQLTKILSAEHIGRGVLCPD
jgi:hypothetical protein